MDVCRICLEASGDDLFYPCRCRAPIHRECLDRWRTSGMNPANLTRCEVCSYHYRLEEGRRTWHIHVLFYVIAILQIIFFFAVAFGFGQLIRATNIVEAVDWGRLSFMKPDTSRGWFFMGICFNGFLIGSAATIYLVFQFVTGRLRRAAQRTRELRTRSHSSDWWTTARESRQRSRDCCRDCYHSCQSSDGDACCVYCYLIGPDCYCYTCEACCGSCDAQCTQCCQCAGDGCSSCECGSCSAEGEGGMIILGLVALLAIVLILLGMFVMFWTVVVNVLYAIWLNQNYLREKVASRYHVLEYNAQYDKDAVNEPPTEGVANQDDEHVNGTVIKGDSVAPAQQAMAVTIGKAESSTAAAAPASAAAPAPPDVPDDDDEPVWGGTLVSIDLTSDIPQTRRSQIESNAL